MQTQEYAETGFFLADEQCVSGRAGLNNRQHLRKCLVQNMLSACLQISNILSGLYLTGETILRIQDVFISELEDGIHEKPSSLQMENTYIPELPDSTGQSSYCFETDKERQDNV
ncbi:hypothetical protein PR048_030413 [Dryococelus australis]|uniref:Uncharacterized protein n=1 Tax=Dryococelus australis TaxID=614101 RepID=A0ABQ9GBL6_9NEOP|nr:hypothetical protein PR048_030413 [Dryococelus australis]